MLRHYVNINTLEIIKSNRGMSGYIMVPKDLEDKEVKVIDEEVIEQRPKVLVDENEEPTLDEDGNTQYETDENGNLVYEDYVAYTQKKVVLDEEAQQQKEAEQAQKEVEQAWADLRAKRDVLLKETDYIMMPDYPMQDKSDYQAFRQALRDLPANTDDPKNPDWPVKPQS